MRPSKRLLSAPPSTGGNTTNTATTQGGGGRAGNATNQWGPFGNAATYGADMALALGILLSAFVLGVLLMVVVRLYLRRRRGPHPSDQKPEPSGAAEGEAQGADPPTAYRAGETELAGAAAECAICLAEFAEGDGLRVLPACRHGFHAECMERWHRASCRSSRPSSRGAAPSCPVCRASCCPPEASPEPEPEP
uniref:RING-H2 finger protein ATL79 n=1 Tax=Anthurium amnicola TaxID=1678845 RepID=A0A1D1XS28_9ARAE